MSSPLPSLPQRVLLVLLGLLLTFHPAPAQPTPADEQLARLLAQREALVRQYEAAQAQRHSLFGNKPSKKDLQEVVDALRGIVAKDSEIVPAVKASASASAERLASVNAQLAAANARLQSLSQGDRNLAAGRFYELRDEVANLEQRARQQVARQRELEAELAEARQGRRTRDLLITGLALSCLGLALAWSRSRRK